MRIIRNELYREVGGDKACNQQQKEIANKVNSKLSSLLKKTCVPNKNWFFEIQFAIKPRLRQNADIKRKCPNSLIIIDTSIKANF
ncbi:MAG: hypothetical protein CM15mP98_12880 [Paracoccaceae bacterium]|nr:MAG: hypothetical protein CM15mP98_12880 [Paracoccaceae bacterium]